MQHLWSPFLRPLSHSLSLCLLRLMRHALKLASFLALLVQCNLASLDEWRSKQSSRHANGVIPKIVCLFSSLISLPLFAFLLPGAPWPAENTLFLRGTLRITRVFLPPSRVHALSQRSHIHAFTFAQLNFACRQEFHCSSISARTRSHESGRILMHKQACESEPCWRDICSSSKLGRTRHPNAHARVALPRKQHHNQDGRWACTGRGVFARMAMGGFPEWAHGCRASFEVWLAASRRLFEFCEQECLCLGYLFWTSVYFVM